MTTLEAALARRRALESGERWAADIGTSGLEERIWLGAGRDAQNLAVLRRRNITHVLNVADDVPNYHEGQPDLTYLQLGVVDFGGDAGASRVFADAIEFVNGVLHHTANGRVLIHCANGSNRSATVAIAVLMGVLGMSLAQAWALVHARRAEASPLQDNRRELLAFERGRSPPGSYPSMIAGAGGELVPTAYVAHSTASEPSPLMPPGGHMPTPAAEDSVRAVGRRVRWKGTGGDTEAMGGLVWQVSGPDGGQLQVLQDVPTGGTERLVGAAAEEVELVVGHARKVDEEAVAEAALRGTVTCF